MLKDSQIEFQVPCMPVSSNVIYKINYAKRLVYMSKEAKTYKKMVIIHCPPWSPPDYSMFSIEGEVWANWFTKAGKLKRLDIPNLTKVTIDGVFQKLGIDDKQVITSGPWKKCQTTDEAHVVIRVSVIDNLVDWKEK